MWPSQTHKEPQAPLSPSNWNERIVPSSPVMSWILLNANNRSWAAMDLLNSMLDLEVILC